MFERSEFQITPREAEFRPPGVHLNGNWTTGLVVTEVGFEPTYKKR